MSYNINVAKNPTIVINDGTKNDTSTSLTLVGRNYPNYGAYIAQDLVNLMQSWAGDNQPSSAVIGQLWYDTLHNALKIYNGASFKNISGLISNSSAPIGSSQGDLWYNTSTSQLYIYTGGAWLLIGPSYTSSQQLTAALADTIVDNTSSPHTVLKLWVGGVLVGIVSKDAQFTPQTAITGFPTVNPGYNVNAAIYTAAGILINGTLTTNAQPYVTSVGTLSQLSVSSDINANILGYARAVSNPSQPNITSLGTLNTLTVTNPIAGSISGYAATVSAASQPNITSIGSTLTVGALSTFTGALRATNITGTTALVSPTVNAGMIGNSGATIWGTLNASSAIQTNITSVGTLTGLTVSGTTSLGSITNVKITGGANGQYITTDGAGNLSWVDAATSPLNNTGQAGQLPIYTGTSAVAGNSKVTFDNTTFSVTGNVNASNFNTVGTIKTNSIKIAGTGIQFADNSVQTTAPTGLPSQTNYGGNVLVTNGTTASWARYTNTSTPRYIWWYDVTSYSRTTPTAFTKSYQGTYISLGDIQFNMPNGYSHLFEMKIYATSATAATQYIMYSDDGTYYYLNGVAITPVSGVVTWNFVVGLNTVQIVHNNSNGSGNVLFLLGDFLSRYYPTLQYAGP
jgi:hypothetical protein